MYTVCAVVALAVFVVAVVCLWRDTGTAMDSRWIDGPPYDEETEEVDSVL